MIFTLVSNMGNKTITDPKAISSMTVLPTQVAPLSTRVEITGEVCSAGWCVAVQSGHPKLAMAPLMSNLPNQIAKTVTRCDVAKQEKFTNTY